MLALSPTVRVYLASEPVDGHAGAPGDLVESRRRRPGLGEHLHDARSAAVCAHQHDGSIAAAPCERTLLAPDERDRLVALDTSHPGIVRLRHERASLQRRGVFGVAIDATRTTICR